MKKESLVVALPRWNKPDDLERAASALDVLEQTTQASAYFAGKILQWAYKKHGSVAKFESWVESNVRRFGRDTAWKRMAYAERCDLNGQLLSYLEPPSLESREKASESQGEKPEGSEETKDRRPTNESAEHRPPPSGTVEGWKQAVALVWSLVDDSLSSDKLSAAQSRSIKASASEIVKTISKMEGKL